MHSTQESPLTSHDIEQRSKGPEPHDSDEEVSTGDDSPSTKANLVMPDPSPDLAELQTRISNTELSTPSKTDHASSELTSQVPLECSEPIAESGIAASEAPSTLCAPLMRLPIEVFQMILWHMEVETFFSSQLACKHFFGSAKSKPLLLRQIYRLPGFTMGLADLSNEELLTRFRERARQNGCAAGILADVSKYKPTSKTPLTKAAFSPSTFPEFLHLRIMNRATSLFAMLENWILVRPYHFVFCSRIVNFHWLKVLDSLLLELAPLRVPISRSIS